MLMKLILFLSILFLAYAVFERSALTRSPLDTTFLTKFNFFNVSDDVNVVSISQYIPTVIDVDEQMVISQQNDDAVEELLQNVDEDFCRTSECVLSASRMDSLIDYKVRPCDDFYNFACGRFVRDSTLHDRRDSLNAFSITDDKLKEQLRRLFTRKVENHEIKPFRLAKMLYKSCINSCAAEVRGIEPLKNIIQAIGGWPMLGDWNESGWNLEQSIMKLRLQFSNNAKNIFRAAKPFTIPLGAGDDDARASLGGSKSDKRKSQKFLQAYRSYLIDIAVIVGADRRTVESQIDDAIEFQIELTKLSLRRESSGAFGVIANRVSLNYSLMQWLDLFQSVPDQFLVDGNQKSALSGNDFFNAFEKLWSKTSKQTLANFFILRIVGFSSQYMTKEMKQRALHYRMELFGVKQKEESWKQCVDVVSKTLKLAAEAMFSKEYFDLRSKETAIDIAVRVKRAYVEILSTIPWMKSAEKAKAILTVDKIIAKLRFPKERLSDQQIDFFYRQLSIEKPENYLETVFRLTTFIADRKFLLLQIGINLDAEESVGVLSSVDVKDYNPILFPAGVLQKEILSPEQPNYLKYGTVGFILGYVFSQAVNSLKQSTPGSYPKNVTDGIECLVRQYDSYVDPETGIKNNGKATLDSNVADMASLAAAYTSYKRWISENESELRLPAIKFSNAQLFWVAYAQLFCSVTRPEKRKNLNYINPHSIERFRVIGPLSNSQDFAKAFACPNNSPMNPSSKCSLL